MIKCDKCGLEKALYKIFKEVVDKEEKEKRIYVCRNKKCSEYKKEN